MQIRNRVPSRIAVLIFLCGLAAALLTEPSAGLGEEQTQRRFEILGIQSTLEERLGRDDDAALVIHFEGDTRGTLEPCG